MIDRIELDWLKKWSEFTPEAVSLKVDSSGREFTYAESFAIANRIAKNLKDKNINRGDRVAVLSRNRIEMVFLFFALQRIGAIFVPINFRLSAAEVDYILQDSGAKLLFFDEDFVDVVSTLKSENKKQNFKELEQSLNSNEVTTPVKFEADFEDVCKILYTSGTTGFPKGAMITHKMLFWNSISTGLRLNLTQHDVTVAFAPLFHTGGWNVLFTPFLHRGAKTVFLEEFDVAKVLRICDEEKVTLFFGVPTMLDMMAHHQDFEKTTFDSVRFAIVGGEPMPIPLIHTWANKNVPVRQGFGLTEFGPNCFSLGEEYALSKSGSIGQPNFYIDVKIVDDEGKEVSVGETGELLLRGPMCMKGYWQNQEATDNTIKDGWLHTGDLVRRDEEGFFYVAGRKKDMFISGGENVYPAEVEKTLNSFPQVREVAVIGVPDEKWGEVGKAFVVMEEGIEATPNQLKDFCQEKLAKYKVPKHYQFLSELPKGDSGKILKRRLVELEESTRH